MTNEIIIDATGGVVGRMASFSAKKLLLGSTVVIVNCDEAIVTGPRKALIEQYRMKRTYGGTSHKGPYYSRVPERMVRRAIRGMLPWPKARATEAFKRAMCFNGVPSNYASKEKLSFKKEIKDQKFMKLKEISKLM